MTFNGVVAALRVGFDNPNPPVNTTTTVKVLVSALDADGNTIIGPGVYDHPIVVADGDTSGATTMTTTTLNGPADPAPTLTYNGSWIGGDSAIAPITATVPANAAVKPFTGALAPMPQVTEYTIPTIGSQPQDLVKGPDGNVWFTENAGKIGRVTTSGTFAEFVVPDAQNTFGANPWGITAGPDGNLWFTDQEFLNESIDKITVGGIVTRYPVGSNNVYRPMYTIVTGPDGNLWTTSSNDNKIVRMTTGGAETDFTVTKPLAGAQNITTGPDGALWFTETNGSQIGRIQTDGTISEYTYTVPAPSFFQTRPTGITTGPDGALWFTDPGQHAIGRMTTASAGAEFRACR